MTLRFNRFRTMATGFSTITSLHDHVAKDRCRTHGADPRTPISRTVFLKWVMDGNWLLSIRSNLQYSFISQTIAQDFLVTSPRVASGASSRQVSHLAFRLSDGTGSHPGYAEILGEFACDRRMKLVFYSLMTPRLYFGYRVVNGISEKLQSANRAMTNMQIPDAFYDFCLLLHHNSFGSVWRRAGGPCCRPTEIPV